MEITLKEQLLIKQAENDVMSAYQLVTPIDFLGENGLSKSANFSEEDQALYDYAANEALVKLAEAGIIDLPTQELAAEDVLTLIARQAQNDALSELNLTAPVDFIGQFGLSKSATNWPEECQDFYAGVYNDTVTELSQQQDSVVKTASQDPLSVAAQAYVDEITQQAFNRNLKKTASDFEAEYLNSLR